MYHLNTLAGTPTQKRSITRLTDRIANVSNNPKFIVIIYDTSTPRVQRQRTIALRKQLFMCREEK